MDLLGTWRIQQGSGESTWTFRGRFNLELSAASKWGKIIEPDIEKGIANMKQSIEAYKRSRKLVDEYKVKKEIKSDKDLEKDLQT